MKTKYRYNLWILTFKIGEREGWKGKSTEVRISLRSKFHLLSLKGNPECVNQCHPYSLSEVSPLCQGKVPLPLSRPLDGEFCEDSLHLVRGCPWRH